MEAAESTNDQPAVKSARREEEPVSSPEVNDPHPEVRQLEANLEDAWRVAHSAELRAEAAESRLDSISSQLEDSKRETAKALAVNSELTRKNEALENEMALARNDRVKDRSRIDELTLKLAQSEAAKRVKKTRPKLLMDGTSARTRPFCSNHPPVPSLTSTPATSNSILAALSTPSNDVRNRVLGTAKSAVGVEEVRKNRVGRPAKKTSNVNDREFAMKIAPEHVQVKKYTENLEDWTPFDAFLKRNYQILASSYNEEPSNALALKIKRTVWTELIKGGVPSLWEKDAAKFREEGVKREYWGSETVVEQEERVVRTERGVRVVPLGGEEIEGESEECIDRSRRRKQPMDTHQRAHKIRRSAPSVLAAAEVDELPSTSSSSMIDDIEDEQTTSTSRRSARRGQRFYRALAGTRAYGKD